ncbi:MAG: hypothetical protein ABR582_08825 [Gemmatimonadaceae bacterium]
MYVLYEVDGKPLPAAIEAGSCPTAIVDGQLSLTPQLGATEPLYTTIIETRKTCMPFSAAPAPDILSIDVGSWDSGIPLQLHSEKGLGTLRADVYLSSNPITLTFSSGSYRLGWKRVRDVDPQLAFVTVHIVDIQGRAINGAFAELESADGIYGRGVTNNDRPFSGSASSGLATIRVAPPTGYILATGQSETTTVEVVAGQRYDVRVTLQKTS